MARDILSKINKREGAWASSAQAYCATSLSTRPARPARTRYRRSLVAVDPRDFGYDERIKLVLAPPAQAPKAHRLGQAPFGQHGLGRPQADPKASRHFFQTQHLHTRILV